MVLGGMVIFMLLLLVLRIPVAFSMFLPCLIYVIVSPDITLGVALQRATAGINSFPLLAVPLFVLTGYLSNAAGLADRLFHLLYCVFGRIPGSLGYVNVVSGVVFSWMSGAAVADAAGLGTVMVPAMKKRGYREEFALGLTGASALVGPIMPPSIPAIIYAVAGGVSVSGLFLAGVIPAIVMALILCIAVFLNARRHPLTEDAEVKPGEFRKALFDALPILLTPVIVLGGILGGVFTPTEAAAAAVMYVLALGVLFRTLTWRGFYEVLSQTTATAGTILLIVSAAGLFGWIIAREQGPQIVAEALLRLTESPWIFLMLVNAALLVVGMFLEPVAALLITVPILLPVANKFGIDPIHFGMVMILNLVIGLLTPPVGLVIYVLSSVTGCSVQSVIRGTIPFLVPLMMTLLIVTFFPSLSLWLPSLLK